MDTRTSLVFLATFVFFKNDRIQANNASTAFELLLVLGRKKDK